MAGISLSCIKVNASGDIVRSASVVIMSVLNMCDRVYETWQGIRLLHFMLLTRKHQQTSQQRRTKTKELREGKNLQRCKAAMIKEVHARRTNTHLQ